MPWLFRWRVGLQFVLLQPLDVGVYAVQLGGYVDALRAMGATLATPDAVAGLAQLGHAAVVAHYSLIIFSRTLFY